MLDFGGSNYESDWGEIRNQVVLLSLKQFTLKGRLTRVPRNHMNPFKGVSLTPSGLHLLASLHW